MRRSAVVQHYGATNDGFLIRRTRTFTRLRSEGRSVALLLEARGRLRKRKIEHAKPFRRAMTQTARAKAGCRRCRGKPGITRNSCSAPESVGILPSRRNRIRNSRRSWGAAGSCSCGTRSRTGKRQSTWFPAGRIHSVGVEQAAVSPAAI
jgi:hypothetical protein